MAEDFDFWLSQYPEIADICTEKKAELTALQARWDEADRRIGHSRAAQAEAVAAKREERLLRALWVEPAQSLAGVALKLDVALCHGEWCDDCGEFPWPQIRSVLEDLIRIGELEQFAMEAMARNDLAGS
ncbi:hypothetical protein [Paramesorhizobium deserti]|uniref:hypothetical protein n=1 Tax=Paramesorhizobium deserti TaxID=1494590 RepID=UPI00128FD3C7|nr:hypothetical protein [Paramesorhizobium deserti]